ncbi:3D domain-containing protein [Alkalibacterium kapii]|uniref:Uncharacterized protein n=1 Tax=Alkalibacterium kapii TaxID=426704 RepID=A0A511AXQ8_9LACT|nr:3D domain-containing protein [Alkalibacterium kapii]GEK91921.1 hypothetical protein AKA01nite_15430 [Alkalibacterium kapii]
MIKRVLSLAIIALTFIQMNTVQPVSAESLNEINIQQTEKKQEIRGLQENVNTVIEEVNTLNEALSSLNKTITEKEQDIKTTEANIMEQEEIVSARMEQARDRLKSLQVNEISQNIVLTLLKSESVSDMFNRFLVIMRLTDAGNEQIELAEEEVQKLADLKENLIDSRAELEEKQDKALSRKNDLDDKIASLQEMIQENQAELSVLAKKESEENARLREDRKKARQNAVVAAANKTKDKQEVGVSSSSSEKQTSAEQSNAAAPKTTQKTESKPAKATGRTLKVQATGYSTQQPGLSKHTYMGIDLRVNPRVIAVDPSVIPLGSMVEVEGMGVYLAGDTGGAINGKIIDIHFSTVAEALKWGRRNVTVRILN